MPSYWEECDSALIFSHGEKEHIQCKYLLSATQLHTGSWWGEKCHRVEGCCPCLQGAWELVQDFPLQGAKWGYEEDRIHVCSGRDQRKFSETKNGLWAPVSRKGKLEGMRTGPCPSFSLSPQHWGSARVWLTLKVFLNEWMKSIPDRRGAWTRSWRQQTVPFRRDVYLDQGGQAREEPGVWVRHL